MRDYKSQERRAAELLEGPPGVAHLMGIGGVGMAGLARLLAARGWKIGGCDIHLNDRAMRLENDGIMTSSGHDPEHVAPLAIAANRGTATALFHSAAIRPDHPEIAAARAAGIAVIPRGVMLAACLSAHPRSIAVCGAHGKTTTTLFTARLLLACGKNVEWCIGGEAAPLGEVAGRGGGPPEWLVAEADESDGTLALYRPLITVLTNIDADHLEHFGGMADLADCYAQAIAASRQGVAWCADDPLSSSLCASRPGISFGFGSQADLRAADITSAPFASAFTIYDHGQALARIAIDIPGRHNILNALAALAAAILAGVPPATAAALLTAACGELPHRRYETVTHVNGCRVVNDYAHHPRELAALIAMARPAVQGKLIIIFQPHRYTRTLALRDDFPSAFDGADLVILLPVYAASEEPVNGGETVDLYAAFRRLRPGNRVIIATTADEAWHAARQRMLPGDLLILAGAGDVTALAGKARAEAVSPPALPLAQPLAQPLAELGRHTSFGVGGRADWLADAANAAELAELLAAAARQHIPVAVMGAGANTLVADSGARGLVIRLKGEPFRRISIVAPAIVEAGCGLSGTALLNYLEEAGLSGLEFLDSIPGSVGGLLAMNAGAHGGAIGERVVHIECLNLDGTHTILSTEQCGFGYRLCAGLQGRIAVAARLALTPATSGEVSARRAASRARRAPLAGLRTAGSVFRNPEGAFAGALLEAAGCKGWRVGGAYVCAAHANVIAADSDASASDVIALLTLMQRAVRLHCGVSLDPEIKVLR